MNAWQREATVCGCLIAPPKVFTLEDFYTDECRAREGELQKTFPSTEAIQEYVVDGFDIGYAALSSTVFSCRDAYLESAKDRELLGRMIVAAWRSFASTREFLARHPDFDRVYIFNGRFASCRGPLRACQQANVEVHLHERGSNNSKYMIFENRLPHDLKAMEQRIRQYWEDADSETREQQAASFFDGRRARVEEFWHSHTKAQQRGRMPASWDAGRRNVAVYTSSDDEYVAIGKEWVSPGFESQSQAIVNLYNNLQAGGSDVHLYIRMHPHLNGVDNRDTRKLLALSGPGVEVIPPKSAVCSYSLMDNCEKVITFGSTIGVEATWWGKPSILAGMNFYRALDGAWIANGDKELPRIDGESALGTAFERRCIHVRVLHDDLRRTISLLRGRQLRDRSISRSFAGERNWLYAVWLAVARTDASFLAKAPLRFERSSDCCGRSGTCRSYCSTE